MGFLRDSGGSIRPKTEKAAFERLVLFALAQLAHEIPPAIRNSDNLNPRLEHAECDSHPSLEADDAQARQYIVPAMSPLWKLLQRLARRSDAANVTDGDDRRAIVRNVVVQLRQPLFSATAEYDPTCCHACRLSRAGYGALRCG